MCHQFNSNAWHRLRPDSAGSYQNGSWDNPPIAAMPNGNDPSFGCSNCTYAPLYFSSVVLKDGRIIVMGGEDINLKQVDTNIGFIYDSSTDTWSKVTSAFSGGSVGDAMGVDLPDGTFAIQNILTTNLQTLNPTTGVFTAKNPTGKLDRNDEEGWYPLYDGTVLTIDSGTASSYEIYTPSSNSWTHGSMPVNLTDFGTGVGSSQEVGPCSLRPDSKLVCFSGNSLGENAIYDTSTKTWSHTTSMDFPAATGGHFSVADGPAATLPNGNVLVMASPVTNTKTFNAPSHFYEMSLSSNTLTQVNDTTHASSFASFEGRMLVLPTGQVLLTAYDQNVTQDVALYSNGGGPQSSYRPIITSAPSTIAAGGVYTISGKQFNGFAYGATYGDDAQSATNFPLVRLTNQTSGHVVYARTYNFSRMGVEAVGSSTVMSATFKVPAALENGATTLEVVTNGIASNARTVQTTFTPLQLINGWTGAPFATSVPALSTINGIVQFRGAMGTSGSNTSPFLLPSSSRPSTDVYVPVDLCNAALGRLHIQPSGQVDVQVENSFSDAQCFTSLEGVSFALGNSGFTALTLENGWTNAPFSTRNVAVKNDGGIIRFEGAMATSGTNATAFNLPAGFRPATDVYVPVDLCDSTKGRIRIQPSGDVDVEPETSFSNAQCFTSLEGATFAINPSGYTSVTLENGWTNAPFSTRSVAVRNDNNGVVHFQGAIGNGSNATLFNLPQAFRPAVNVYVNVDLCGSAQGRIDISTTGDVTVEAPSGFANAQCFTSLEGVSFAYGL
jgi:hypothetical protein